MVHKEGFDGRGCLSGTGIAMLRDAPIGAAPPELAGHLASCTRCQERMLAAEAGARALKDGRARAPQPMRTVLLLALVLLLGGLVLASAYWTLYGRLT
jgi:hypothetical protein